jgi:hypothetical protein
LALLAILVATVTSYELGEHSGLSRAGFFGMACASSAALGVSGYAVGVGRSDREQGRSARADVRGYTLGASALASLVGVLAWVEVAMDVRAARWAALGELPTRSLGELVAQYLTCRPRGGDPVPHAILCGGLVGAAFVLWGRTRGTLVRSSGAAFGLLVALGLTFRLALD